MSAYLTLLTLLLPLSTLATPMVSKSGVPCWVSPVWCPNPSPNTTNPPFNTTDLILADSTERIKPAPPTIITGLTPSTASGDVLNTTRCYCASPDWRNDHTYGFYQLFTYYNFHHDAIYTMDVSCHSSEYKVVKHYHDERVQPACLRELNHERYCQETDNRGEIGNTFCYEMNGGSDSDRYYYNKQKRGLPIGAAFRESEQRTLEICGGLCREKAGGLDMLDGEALTAVVNDPKGVGPSEWSAILSFGDTDDMCESCK